MVYLAKMKLPLYDRTFCLYLVYISANENKGEKSETKSYFKTSMTQKTLVRVAKMHC